MTKDRALQVLHVYASVNGSGRCTQDEFEEAKKMAIEALIMMRPRDKFCKMCGAKMEGEKDG